MLTQRITLFACYAEQTLKARENNPETKNSEDFINIYDYLSYCLFFPIVMSVSSNEYSHYCMAIRGFYVKKFFKVRFLGT